jgi:acetoin utilization deacetylase AcuC-like enzyme
MKTEIPIIYPTSCIDYSFPGHPETPVRILTAHDYLKHKDYKFISPKPCSEGDILLAHTKELVDKIKTLDFDDPDTPRIPDIYKYAILLAGGATEAAFMTWRGRKRRINTFSLARPPGHHAGKDSLGGFCYFNNIAIAILKITKEEFGPKKIAILDIDGHHGQGTEEIFLGSQNILCVSLHQRGIYPGTGLISQDNVLNYPLLSGTDEREYLFIFDKAISEVLKFSPDLLAVSAGFDTYKNDPLTDINLEIETYKKIGQRIKDLAVPTFSVLEGGYTQDLPYCIESYLEGLQINEGLINY